MKRTLFIFIVLGLFCFVFSPKPAHAAIAFVNATSSGGYDLSSFSATINATAGNLLYVAVDYDAGGSGCPASTVTISDSASPQNTYTQIGKVSQNYDCITQFYAKNITGSSNLQVSANFTAGKPAAMSIMQFSGLDTSSPLDATSTGSGSAATLTSGSFSTNQANEVIIAGASDYNSSSPWIAGGIGAASGTIPSNATWNQGNSYGNVTAEYAVVSSTQSSITASITRANTGNVGGIAVATFKAASGPSLPDIFYLSASSSIVASAGTSTLSWNITNASSVAITPGNFSTSTLIGSTTVSPTSTTLYTLTATNGNGTSTATTTVTVDSTPPTTPGSLSVSTTTATTVSLTWATSTDSGGSGLSGYNIYRCLGSCTPTSTIGFATTTAYTDFVLVPTPTTFTYAVSAYDGVRNTSALSTTTQATTLLGGPGWTDIPNTALQSVCPPDNFQPMGGGMPAYNFYDNCHNVMDGNSGAALDTKRDQLIIWGGGHEAYPGNEVYALQLGQGSSTYKATTNSTAPTMVRLTDPSIYSVGCTGNGDGTPQSIHSYETLVYLPISDKVFKWSGPNFCGAAGPDDADIFLFNPANNTWQKPTMSWTGGEPIASGNGTFCTLDTTVSSHDSVICFYSNTGMYRFDFSNSGANGTSTPLITYNIQSHPDIVFDPDSDHLFAFGYNDSGTSSDEIYSIDMSTSTYPKTDITSQTTGCNDVAHYWYPGMAWDSAIHQIVGYVPRTAVSSSSDNEIFTFNPSTYTCVLQALPGGPTASGAHLIDADQGVYQRFSYLPWLDKFVLVNNASTDAYTVALNDSGISTPTISSFTASSSIVASAGTSTLSWNITNASSVAITPGNFSTSTLIGSTTVSPTSTTLYTLTATNGNGTSTATTTVTVATAPTAPGSFSVSSLTTSTASLSWASSTPNNGATISFYAIHRGTSTSTMPLIATTTLTVYADSGLASSTTYFWYIDAHDSLGNISASSSIASGTTAGGNLPIVSSFTASSSIVASAGTSTLSFNVTNASSVAITPGNFSTSTLNGSLTVNPTSTVTYTLTATNGNGTSTAAAAVTVDSTPPTIPGSFTVSGSTTSTLTLSWASSIDSGGAGLAGYDIYRGASSSSLSLIQTLGTSTTYTDTGLAASTTYWYTVTAFDGVGNVSGQATSTSGITLGNVPPSISTFFAIPSALPSTGTSTLLWVVTGTSTITITPGSLSTSTLVGSLTVNPTSTITYTLTATGSGGISTSTTSVIIDGASPTAPTNLTVSTTTLATVSLTWSSSTDSGGSGIAGYNIYRCLGSCTPTSTVGVATTTAATFAFTDYTSAASTTYTYAVSALSGAGIESALSSSTQATTKPGVAGIMNGLGFSTYTCIDRDGDGYGVGPLANLVTTSSGSVAPGIQTVTLGSTSGLVVGQRVRYDLAPGNIEFVTLTAVSGNTITANFKYSHPSGATVSAGTTVSATDDPGCLGPDADDLDSTVYTGAQAIAKWGSLNAFLAHLGYYPNTIWYLSPNGTDASTGGVPNCKNNINAPCLTYTYISGKPQAGDMIMLRDQWSGRLSPPSGTAGHPTYVMSYPGEQANPTGTVNLVDVTDRSYVVVDGLKLTGGAYVDGGTVAGFPTPPTITFHDDIFRHIDAVGPFGFLGGIMGFDMANITVEDSAFHDNDDPDSQHGIYMGSRTFESTNIVFQRLLLYHNDWNGIHWNGRCANCVTQNIVAYNNGISGLDFEQGWNHSLIQDNLSFNNAKAFTFYDYPGQCPSQDNYTPGTAYICPYDESYNIIQNNTFYNTGNDASFNPPSSGCPSNVPDCENAAINVRSVTVPFVGNFDHNTFRNNMVMDYGFNNNDPPVYYSENNGNGEKCDATCLYWLSTSVFQNNVFHQEDGKNGTGVLTTPVSPFYFTCVQAGSLTTMTGCTNAPPQFVSAATSSWNFISSFDFHLQASSPGVGMGMSVSTPAYDIIGLTLNSPADIGAYNFISGSSSSTPTISSFTASSSIVASAGTSTLSFNVTNASSVAITPGNFSTSTLNGSLTVNPTSTTIYTLTATNANGTSTAQTTVTVASAPTAPQSLSATAANAQVALSWSAPSSNGGSSLTQYLVYDRFSGSSTFALYGTTTPLITTSTVTSLTNGQSYEFEILAQNGIGTSSASNVVSSTPYTVPNAPTSVSAVAGNAEATISFTPGSNNGSSILYYTATSNPNGISATSTMSPVVIANLTNGQSYTFVVTAKNAAGSSAPSSASNSVTPSNLDPEISSFLAVPGFIMPGASSTLSWNTTLASAVSINQGLGNQSATSTGSSVVVPSSTTLYILTATNSNGTSTAEATVTVDGIPPSVPTNLTANAVSTSEIDLSWASSTDNVGVAGYDIYRNSTKIATTSALSYPDTGLSANTSYTYAIDAFDAAGNISGQTSSTSATTQSASSGGGGGGGGSVGVPSAYGSLSVSGTGDVTSSYPVSSTLSSISPPTYALQTELNLLLAELATLQAEAGESSAASRVPTHYIFTRNLYFGITGNDVKELQEFLNRKGFVVSETGPGSPGDETIYFGAKTWDVLIRFQKNVGIKPASGYFGPITRAYVNAAEE